MLEHLGLPAARITARFSRLVMPAVQRDDVLNARATISLRSTGTLGWDPYAGRPFFSEIPQDTVNAWAGQAQRLAERLELVEPVQVPVPESEADRDWSAAVRTARELGLCLWADDLALRQVARAEGVAAFGTLDLLALLAERSAITAQEHARAVDGLIDARAVDLPLSDRLLTIADREKWQAGGYAALMLSRPAAWSPPAEGWQRYMTLARTLPGDASPQVIAGWAYAAATGLAWATPPVERAHVVGMLLAWTTLNKGDAQLVPLLCDVGERVQQAAMPDGDVLARFVEVLANIVRRAAGAENSGAIVTALLHDLDDERRERAMRVFLGAQ
jgi:hypothetical protein